MMSVTERTGAVERPTIVSVLAERLPRIRTISIEVRSRSSSGWTGRGKGEVVARGASDGTIAFDEHGAFELAATGARLPFRNSLRWTVHADRIVLAHCRQDARAGTRLVEFRAAPVSPGETTLHAAAPHHCGRDCYDAVLRLVDAGFDLHWCITGPRKDEELIHAYRVLAHNGKDEDPGGGYGPIDRS
jgi:hypothetical protein